VGVHREPCRHHLPDAPPIGDIVAAGAGDIATALLDECAQIARRQGFPPSDAMLQRTRSMFTTTGSLLTASMLRDVEHGAQTEVEHILGDLLRRGGMRAEYPVLRIAHAHLATYEARRRRLEAAA
jgi:2-dehydropantoate 2-reductase